MRKTSIVIIAVSTVFVSLLPFLSIEGSALPITTSLRTYRYLNCFCAGAGLSFAGLLFQVVTRNSLADPYLSGSAPAALLGLYLGQVFSNMAISPSNFSVILALLISFIVSLLPLVIKGSSRSTILLGGVIFGSLCLTIMGLLSFFFPSNSMFAKISLGGLSTLDLPNSGLGLSSFFISLTTALSMDFVLKNRIASLSLLPVKTYSLGAGNTIFIFGLMLLGSTVVTLITVSYGLIGFIGFLVPNFIRRVLGVSFGYSALLNVFAGGILLTFIDQIGRWIYQPYGLPASILTSIIGAPLLLYALFISRNRVNSF